MAKSIEIVKLSYRFNLYCIFMTFPTLMAFILFTELPKGSGEFPSLQQYNLGDWERWWKGVGVKGMGSEWSCRPADFTSPPDFRPFPPEKLIIMCINFGCEVSPTWPARGRTEKFKLLCKQGRQVRVGSLARGASDDDNDQDDRIYAV